MINVLTHRGLDPSQHSHFLESSYEAFADHLKRGFGLEFDLQFTSDKQIVISHDSTLQRLSKGTRSEKIADLTKDAFMQISMEHCHFTSLEEMFVLFRHINNCFNPNFLFAIHIKHAWQSEEYLELLLAELEGTPHDRYFLFDLKPQAAMFLKKKNPALQLGASVAHPHDIARYNDAVGGTLISIEELLTHKNIYTWAWLDEWDIQDADGKKKILSTKETFALLRKHRFKIAVVSPELHANSPGLLGSEAHPDAAAPKRLRARLQEIISLKPEAICTDYPDLVKSLMTSETK